MKTVGVSLMLLVVMIFFSACGRSDRVGLIADVKEDVSIPHFTPDVAPDFTLDFGPEFAENPVFDTAEKREQLRTISLNRLESLFADFHNYFGFVPEQTIHIHLVHLVDGVETISKTSSTYDAATGKIVKISIDFPYAMFIDQAVLAHELTHAFIAGFHLPVWADEGMAVYMETIYAPTPEHPVLDSLFEGIRRDAAGVNAVQHWTEGVGIYADTDLTLWCYSYAHTLIDHIQKTYPDAMPTFFSQPHSQTPLTTPNFVKSLDAIIADDLTVFFQKAAFKLE